MEMVYLEKEYGRLLRFSCGLQYPEVCKDAQACFKDQSTLLEANGMHWATVALQPPMLSYMYMGKESVPWCISTVFAVENILQNASNGTFLDSLEGTKKLAIA